MQSATASNNRIGPTLHDLRALRNKSRCSPFQVQMSNKVIKCGFLCFVTESTGSLVHAFFHCFQFIQVTAK